jgi:hypothetical protein
MALFFDARGDNWSVEFFNSGGSAPDPRFINWILKTAANMKEVAKELNVKSGRGITVTTKHSSSIRHQHSKTECGLYSLFYIYARLCGVPYTYFNTHAIPDQHMYELRQHLFNDPEGHKGVELVDNRLKFNFDKVKKELGGINWEHNEV